MFAKKPTGLLAAAAVTALAFAFLAGAAARADDGRVTWPYGVWHGNYQDAVGRPVSGSRLTILPQLASDGSGGDWDKYPIFNRSFGPQAGAWVTWEYGPDKKPVKEYWVNVDWDGASMHVTYQVFAIDKETGRANVAQKIGSGEGYFTKDP